MSYFDLDKRPDASNIEGAINGLFQAGGLFGALSCIATADWLGRRKAIFIGAVISVIGGALQAGSVNIVEYIVMRFITGLGIGMSIPRLRSCGKLTCSRSSGRLDPSLPE